MIGFGFKFSREGLTKVGFAQLMKRLNREWMERQRDERLPKHFKNVPETTPGVGGYKYRKRSKKYTEAKFRKYKHRKPNVLTGELRDSVIGRNKITATQYMSRLVMRGTVDSRLQDWQRREVSAVSRRERVEEARRTAKNYKRLSKLEPYKAKRRRRKK
jgi:hypothetical protein